MIDIHHHCLPGVDDGPRDLEEAADLCRLAAADGIETIIATPHVLRGRWQNTSRALLEQELAALQDAVGRSPRLILGSEYYFAHDMNESLRNGTIVPLAASRYVLVELAAHAVPPLIGQPLYQARLGGWTTVIAHPERNLVFQSNPEMLASLVANGTKTQITAASLLGDFGPDARQCATDWIRRGMVHFVASDAHNRAKRPPRMTEAAGVVREIAGDVVADALTRRNPAAVLENQGLEYDPEPQAAPKRGVLDRLARFWK
ncbi:MAG TPA: CpsB/CapC family capsule biosynthesis tyrosine phosphatase [Thermoanaerobaculia bacterium]